MSLASAAAIALGIVYLTAAAGKHIARKRFRAYLRPLAGRRATAAQHLTIAIELVLGLALLSVSAWAEMRLPAGAASATFLILATSAHAALLAATDTATCHCFGSPRGESTRLEPSWQPAIFASRNTILTACSIAVTGTTLASAFSVASVPLVIVSSGLSVGIVRERRLLGRETGHPKAVQFAPTIATLQAHSWWVNGKPRPF